jgi:hypothetical protein
MGFIAGSEVVVAPLGWRGASISPPPPPPPVKGLTTGSKQMR